MHLPIDADPRKEASVKEGFLTYEPYKENTDPTDFLVTPDECKFSSLAKLNAEIFPWHFGE